MGTHFDEEIALLVSFSRSALVSRAFIAPGRDEARTFQRNWTAVDTLFTCCPPCSARTYEFFPAIPILELPSLQKVEYRRIEP